MKLLKDILSNLWILVSMHRKISFKAVDMVLVLIEFLYGMGEDVA